MKRYNIVMLVDEPGGHILMCRRGKPPYQGLYNLVGGKAEAGEDGLHAAYRELREETGVTIADTTLYHMATFMYPTGGAGLPAYELMAYVGRLRQSAEIKGDENPLLWMPMTENFFDINRYAGEGSIGHVVESVRAYRPWMIEKRELKFEVLPLSAEDLSVWAYYRGCTAEDLQTMLDASKKQICPEEYNGPLALRADGCMVGVVSMAEEKGKIVDHVEIFPPFQHCGFEQQLMIHTNAVKAVCVTDNA